MSDYDDLSDEELSDKYEELVDEAAGLGARGMSFNANGAMMELSGIKREMKERGIWEGRRWR